MAYQIRTLLLAIALAVFAPVASATLVLDFSVLNQVQSVGPNDVVTISGRLTNDATSSENATLSNIGGGEITFFGLTFFDAYHFVFGTTGDFGLQFATMNIAPGQSFDFIFGQFTPTPAPVPAGSYVSGPLEIFYMDARDNIGTTTVNSITVNVASVPEPATLALLGVALAGLGFARRKQ